LSDSFRQSPSAVKPPTSSVVLSVEFDVGVNYSWSCLWYLGHQHLKYKEHIMSVSKEEREDDCDDVYRVVSFVLWKKGGFFARVCQ